MHPKLNAFFHPNGVIYFIPTFTLQLPNPFSYCEIQFKFLNFTFSLWFE
jgi:hypothetical protein